MPDLRRSRAAFRSALHGWFDRHRRDLPWRRAPSLYRTVVSEFMLQQTQVATVLPYFARWLAELPDFAALAAAPEDRVLKLWEGLGYYSRARNLHRLARALACRPAPPTTAAAWRELPGIGPYTAAAIASIACAEPVACVDGNVVRVLARLTDERREFRDGNEAVKFFGPLAGALVAGPSPGRHNEAMMELGATVCLRAAPQCAVCPVARFCAGRRSSHAAGLPRLKPKTVERREIQRAWCEHRGRLLLRRGHSGARRLAGLHELPELADLGMDPPGNPPFAVRRRSITRFAIVEHIHRVAFQKQHRSRLEANAALEWIALDDLDRVTLSGPHRRWITQLIGRDRGDPQP